MATTFEQVYDGFRQICIDQIGANFELSDPYTLERNTEVLLEKGWGITVSASSSFTDQWNTTGEEIPFSLVLTASTLGAQMDPTRIANALKILKQMDLDTRKQLVVQDNIGVSNAGVFFTGGSDIGFITGNQDGVSPLSDQDVVATITMNYIVRILDPLN